MAEAETAPNATAASRDAAAPRKTSRGILALLVAAAVLLLPPILYSIYYVHSRVEYVSARDIRALDTMARQFNEALTNFGDIVETYGRKGMVDDLGKQVKLLTVDDGKTCFASDPTKFRDVVAITYAPHDATALYFGYRPPPNATRDPDAPGPPTELCARAPISTLLTNVLEKESDEPPSFDGTGFDAMFIADADGIVLYQGGASELRLNRIAPQKTSAPDSASSKSTSASAKEKAAHAPAAPVTDVTGMLRATDVSDFSTSGASYKLFTRPIRLPLPFRRFGVAPVPDTEWILGGFVRQGRFNDETRTLPPALVSAIPLLVLLVVLTWPALKLWSIDARERVRAIDVHLLAICATSAVALTTLGAAYLYARQQTEARVDADLIALSGSLTSNVLAELRDANENVQTFVEQAGVVRKVKASLENASTRTSDTTSRAPTRKSEPTPGPSPDLKESLLLDAGSKFQERPYFDMLVWADVSGQQRAKWTTHKSTTPLINIKQFQPFRFTMEEALDELRFDDRAVPLALSVVFSPNTRQAIPIVSERIYDSKSTPGAHAIAYAATVPHLRSVIQPILPLGYGFAILRPDGRVLLHSDSSRNARENFYQECEPSLPVKASVDVAQADNFDVRYQGRPHRMRVTPLANLRLSLAVFHDETLVGAAEAEMLLSSLVVLLGCILLYLATIALGILLWRDQSPQWMWPDANGVPQYGRGILACAVLAVVVVWFVLTERGLPMVAASILAAAAGEAYVLFDLSDEEVPTSRRRVALAVMLLSLILLVTAASETGDARTSAVVVVAVVVLLLLVVAAILGPRAWTSGSRDRRALVWGYCGLWVAMIVLVAVLPSLAIFKDAYDHGMETLARAGQVQLADDLAKRGERLARRYRDVSAKENFLRDAVAYPRDVYYSRKLLGQHDYHPGRIQSPAPTTRLQQAATLPSASLHALLSGMCLNLDAEYCALLTRHPAGFVSSYFPMYDDDAARLRRLAYERSANDRWLTVVQPTRPAQLEMQVKNVLFGYYTPVADEHDADMVIRGHVPLLRWPTSAAAWVLCAAMLAVWLLIIFRFVRWLADALFGIEVWFETSGEAYVRPMPELQEPDTRATESGAEQGCAGTSFGTRFAEACRRMWHGNAGQRLARLLEDECWSNELKSIADDIGNRDDAAKLPPEQVIKEIGERARDYYKEVWAKLRDDEKLTLVQLARNGFVNPRKWDVIRDASRMGLVRRTPAVRFRSESFRRFVATTESAKTIAAWEKPESRATWADPRTVAGTLVVAGACLIVFTQPDLFQSWVAVASGVVGGVPVFMKLIGLATNRPGEPGAKS